MKNKKIVIIGTTVALSAATLAGCGIASLSSKINDLKGQITGNTYNCSFYTNTGEEFMNMSGKKIDMDSNVVKEPTYSDGDWGYVESMSSVVTITIDGEQVESCGSTILFAEKGLEEEVDFQQEELNSIDSESSGITDNTLVAKMINGYQNYFGKPTVVVVQSQLGDPICAYSGDDVYWEVCEDLPKTTKITIDGKALYIHRANFQIIDKDLLK